MQPYYDEVPMNVRIGARMRTRRLKCNFSQMDMAAMLSVDRSTYCKYECGELSVKMPSLLVICHTLNCSLDYILGRVNDPHGFYQQEQEEQRWKFQLIT